MGGRGSDYVEAGCADYVRRLGRYARVRLDRIEPERGGRSGGAGVGVEREGERLLGRIGGGSSVILLDERGERLSSVELAGLIESFGIYGQSHLTFIVGGAWGVSAAVRARADRELSLSAMTLSHGLARLVLLEQLYRSFTIIRGEPYHHA